MTGYIEKIAKLNQEIGALIYQTKKARKERDDLKKIVFAFESIVHNSSGIAEVGEEGLRTWEELGVYKLLDLEE